MLFELEGVTVSIEGADVLKDVSLFVGEGEALAIIGANGAGKTTLLRTISGLRKPRAGSIRFMGKEIGGLLPDKIVRGGIIHIPQGRKLFPRMTVFHNLMLGAYLRSDKAVVKGDLENIYKRFPVLRERSRQLAGTLSGGEQQMLAVGRGLMAKPKLLLLDEPSLGLAPHLVDTIGNIIRDINQEGIAIILVEQNARMALEVCHRAYVLELGKVVLQGTSSDLVANQMVKAAYLGI